MPDWVASILIAIIAATGGWGTAVLQSRAKARDDRQTLIDQLQEERATYIEQLDKERADYMAKLDRMWTDKAASREHVAQLRDHIWTRKDPPPPEPPVGYIH